MPHWANFDAVGKPDIAILCPCYNEAKIIGEFLDSLIENIASLPHQFNVVVINDRSSDNTLEVLSDYQSKDLPNNTSLSILDLNLNVGHQGAIYQGLLHAQELKAEKVIVMDSDGEDNPEIIQDLIAESQNAEVVVVQRGKRHEGLIFKVLYYFYRLLFRQITKKSIDFGNFCIVSAGVVDRLVYSSYIHFPAFLAKLDVTKKYLVADKSKRLGGKSKMGINGLIVHGLKSMVEFADELLISLLKLFFVTGVFIVAMIGFVFFHKLYTNQAIPGWASTTLIGLLNMALISLGFFILGIMIQNHSGTASKTKNRSIYKVINKDD